METTIECCSSCGAESELEATIKLQKCTECGAPIMPCSLCLDQNHRCDFHYTNEERTKGKCSFSEEH
jgi:predicted RNA-binding Zn-ribbon protein involved in translation (DUF1610 family)